MSIYALLFAIVTEGWTTNGATACQRYLTPDVVAQILAVPAEPPKRNDVNACQSGIIFITLKTVDTNLFRQEIPRILGAHPISGIGDAAFWNEAGALAAVIGRDRECDISVIVPQQAKVHGAELAQKLGAICNKLFALP